MKNGTTTTQNEINDNNYRRRKILAQVLATFAIDCQFFSLGAAISYGPVEVSGLSRNDDIIQATDDELSWIGSLCFIMQATGNIFGGPLTAWIGRKRAMLFGNIPYILAWVMMWKSNNLTVLLLGNALLGFGTGLNCAPMVSYIGEVCEPSLRGVLASSAEVFVALGTCGVFVLGTFINWRLTALTYLCIAVFATIVILLIPETPIWLLSKNRENDALKSMCWLRGWVKPEMVKQEFDKLLDYNRNNQRCRQCEAIGISSIKNPEKCTHININFSQRCKNFVFQLGKREARRPLALSALFFIFSGLTCLTSIKPTMVNLLTAFNVPMDAKWTMVYVGVATVIGAVLCMSLVKVTGKRPIAIWSMFGSSICTILLGVYAHYHIPPETSSYVEILPIDEATSVIPLVLFVIMVICNTVGIIPITWMIISEIFPYNVRGICCGFVGAICDISFFIAAKTYLDVETAMHIYGALYFYGAVTFVGFVYLYLFMIETENKPHAEIEASFADKNNVIYADDFIARKVKTLWCSKQPHKTDTKSEDDEQICKHSNKEIGYLNEAYVKDSQI